MERGQMPVTEIIAIILAIIVLLVGIAIALYLSHGGNSISTAIVQLFSFRWLYGGGL